MVLAAAIEAGATVVVTANLPNFPPASLAGHGGTAVHPDAGGGYSNRERAGERLVLAWNQGVEAVADDDGGPDDPLIDTSTEPRGRARTPLTSSEVDAVRTARAAGVGVNTLARQYGVVRQTIWAKARSR